MHNIIVIDDDKQMRTLIRRVMETQGFEVKEAENGREGVRLYNEQPYSIVITDLIMPEREGLETIRELRKEYSDPNIIAISGGGVNEAELYLKLAGNLGVKCVMEKPIIIEDLITAVHRLLGDSNQSKNVESTWKSPETQNLS